MPIRYSNVVGGSSSTGFNLNVGSSGNTTFYFDSPQPAGGYSITSQLSDSSIEFYAIAEDGTLSGYTNTKAMSVTKDFDTLVVYGASTNDLITFEYKSTVLPTASGDQDSGAAPFITSISDADLASIDDTTIITGGNFATDVTVTFTGTDTIVLAPKSVVRTNSTQLIVTRPDLAIEDNAPYTITVTNPGITNSSYATYTTNVTAGGDPTWTTPAGTLLGGIPGEAYTLTLEATDPDGGPIEYQVVSGTLPSGLSINSSTGEISGTASIEETANFTISATDNGGNITNRAFSIVIAQPIPNSIVLHLDAADSNSYSGSGTTWYDISGNSNNGTLSNVTYDANGYFLFNGSNSYVNLGQSALVGSGTSPLTAEIWMYVNNALTNGAYIMPIRAKQDTEFFTVIFDSQGTIYSNLVFRGNTQWGNPNAFTRANLEGQWVQLVARYNGGGKSTASSYTTFRNGVNLGSGSSNFSGAGGSANWNAIGKDSSDATVAGGTGNGTLNGRVAIYRLYNASLTDTEIADLYNFNKARFGLS